jgi:hypothetical protein
LSRDNEAIIEQFKILHSQLKKKRKKEKKERKKKKKKERKEKKEKRNLSKKRKRHTKNNTLVKHWYPLLNYCLVLQCNLVLFPEMSASQPFRKGSGEI